MLAEKEIYWHEKKLFDMLKDKGVTHCYIVKSGLYYNPNYRGYTDLIFRAGVYEKKDAIEHGLACHELIIIPINKIEHNKALMDEISLIQSKLI